MATKARSIHLHTHTTNTIIEQTISNSCLWSNTGGLQLVWQQGAHVGVAAAAP